MRKQGLKRFVLLSLLALLPVVLLVGLYVVKDPFHVLRPYDGNAPACTDSVQLTVNTCYVSTEAFRFFEPSRHFDSFLFGSSLIQQTRTVSEPNGIFPREPRLWLQALLKIPRTSPMP